MSNHAQTLRLAEVCCPHCYLLTRADSRRCLHCHKLLRESSQDGGLSESREASEQRNVVDALPGRSSRPERPS